MILPWNRREAYVTMSMQKQAEVRDRLTAGGVAYILRTVNRNSPSPFYSSRARTGTFGQDAQLFCTYIFYVAKKDLRKAKLLLGGQGALQAPAPAQDTADVGGAVSHSLLTICSV